MESLETLARSIVPVCFIIGLGVFSAWKSIISRSDVRPLSVFVVIFALPAALFVGTFRFTVAELMDWQFGLALLAPMFLAWVLTFAIGLTALKIPRPAAAILGLNSSFPDMAYLGIPILVSLYAAHGLLPAIIGNLVSSFVLIPLTVAFLHNASPSDMKKGDSLAHDLLHTVMQPLVWAPLLAVMLVLAGFQLPALGETTIGLIGQAAGGVALFALGVILYGTPTRLSPEVYLVFAFKNLLQPAAAFGMLLLLQRSGPIPQGIVIVLACPCATASAMFASTYRVAEGETASAILVSTVSSLATIPFWILVSQRFLA